MSQAPRAPSDHADAPNIDFGIWYDDQYGLFEYDTRDGKFYFAFDLQPAPAADAYPADEVRIFIVEQPDYAGRSEGAHDTHRYGVGSGRPWICIKDSERPTNVPDALSWAVYWAEKTAEYIRTGTPFS